MKYLIRPSELSDAEGRGHVHYHAWNETYRGIIDASYLDERSIEKCIAMAKKFPENTYVALVNNKIVGFASYYEARDQDLTNTGEIVALYVLKEYQGQGIGKALVQQCLTVLQQYKQVSLWVLKENSSAISFYQHIGFVIDGFKKQVQVSEKVHLTELRMIMKNKRN